MWSLLIFCMVMPQVLSHDGKVDSRIVGGKETTIEKHPYQVAIRNKVDKNVCGGFIISKHYIVTAAHCVVGVVSPYTDKIVVKAGSTSRTGGTDIPLAEVKSHPKYGSDPRALFDNDVAFMKTHSPIEFSDTMRAIALPPLGRTVSDAVTVTGWGKTSDNSAVSNTLRVVKLPVIDMAECKKRYGHEFTDNMWCAGDVKLGNIGSCGGDSGGPAVQDDMVVGIVAFGGRCGAPSVPPVFTNVAAPSIRNFITDYTEL